MTSRKEFEAWADRKGLYASDRWIYFEGWQARGELDAKRIAELENNLEGVNFVYEKAKTHIEVLEANIMEYQAKLAIAVEALLYYADQDIKNAKYYPAEFAKEALTKIKGE